MANEVIYSAMIPMEPKTKKNGQEIRFKKDKGLGGFYKKIAQRFVYMGIPFIAQNTRYEQYERDAGWFLKAPTCGTIDCVVNVRCLFYRKDYRRVDLTNLEEALDDILVKYKVLKDDNFKILAGHDGSRVLVDPENPRTEIYIERLDVYN